jgi:DNA (cytosine-5)-methyltransferase 1
VSASITDLFCGAGGSSLGAELAGGRLLLGLNHWRRAIETHAANFPHGEHDCADVSALTTAQIRRYPDSDILGVHEPLAREGRAPAEAADGVAVRRRPRRR